MKSPAVQFAFRKVGPSGWSHKETQNMTSTSTATCAQTTVEQEAYEIAVEAFFYFYPLLSMDITRRQTCNLPAGQKPGFGPANSFNHMRAYPDANFRTVVRPNFDTLYSSAWLDLTKEPMIVSVPDMKDRYYLLPMLDMWSDVFCSPGWRTSGTKKQQYAVVQQGWSGQIPSGVERIEAPSPYVWIIGRTKTDGPDDYKAVNALQDEFGITPLSHWGKEVKSPDIIIDPELDMKTPPLEYVNGLSAHQYFAKAAELLKSIKTHSTDWSQIARLKRIGFVAGESYDLSKQDRSIVEAIELGAADALKIMTTKTKTMGTPVNGWSMNTETMGVYGNYYLKRAIVAMVGLGANQPEDAVYPLNFADVDGKPLYGENKYVLRFSKEEMPPVHAFWSVTMYDGAGFQVANELNRFAISSWMPLKKNEDGSLDIYIQHENPGAEKESNWLPSPSSGLLGITMRLYAPQSCVLVGDWVPPAIKKI